jgi:hypothetical protein
MKGRRNNMRKDINFILLVLAITGWINLIALIAANMLPANNEFLLYPNGIELQGDIKDIHISDSLPPDIQFDAPKSIQTKDTSGLI